MKAEVAAEIADTVRRAITKAGHESEQIIIIGQINVQLNMAQGGGAMINVRNE